MTEETPRHFGKFRSEEVVVVGYKKSMNACLICRVTSLPQDEAAELRRIASSTKAQAQDYLIPTLQIEKHKSGTDWFTYLVTRLYRNDGSVLSMPIKEVEDMNPAQKAFFKGYGDSVEDAKKKQHTEAVIPPVSPTPLEEMPSEDTAIRDTAQRSVAPADPAMVNLLQQLIESQQEMTKEIKSLSEKVNKPARRTTKKKTAKKKTEDAA